MKDSAADISRLFDEGNYAAVLLKNREEDWRTHAARALLGDSAAALSGLARFSHPAARFYEAAAYWMEGDEKTAVAILSALDAPHARNLLRLIRRPRLQVLSLLPSPGHGPHVLLSGAAYDPKFVLTNIGYGPEDRPARPEADIFDYVDPATPPDFLICEMVEWHPIPPNLTALPCPLLGHTADFDLHLQSVTPWLRLFDEILVSDPTEFADVRRLVDRPVTTFPKVFGRPAGLPLPERRERDIDLFLSGTLFSPAHPDKAALLHELLEIDDLKMVGFNGFLNEAAYYDLLARSRLGIAYCRHPGAMVTRGIEAACMGCVTLVQEGSVLTLFAGDALATYSPEPGGLRRAVRHVLDHYDAYEDRAWRGARALRRTLSPDAVASHYLRYCTVLAARPRPPRRPTPPEQAPVQIQTAFWKGWRPGDGDPKVERTHRRAVVARLSAALDRAPSAQIVNNIARELLIEAGRRLIRGDDLPDDDDDTPAMLNARALALYQTWLPQFPHALAARFNYLRASVHFGTVEQVRSAWALLTCVKPPDDGQGIVTLADDLLPYDWGETHFDYRAALDLLTAAPTGDEAALPVATLILAAVDHYLAQINDDLEMARSAVKKAPGFPWYRLDLAKRLAARGDAAERAEAVALLSDLCRNSVLTTQAFHVLSRLRREGAEVEDFSALARRTARIEACLYDVETTALQISSLYHPLQVIHSGRRLGPQVHRSSSASAQVSAVFVTPAWMDLEDYASSLRSVARPDDGLEIVCVNPYDDLIEAATRLADTTAVCGQSDFQPHFGRALNIGLAAATGVAVLLLTCPPDDPIALRRALDAAARLEIDDAPLLDADGPGGVRLIVALRSDLLLWGGFDEHEALGRRGDAFGDMADRIMRAAPAVRRSAGGGDGPFRRPDAMSSVLWPGLDRSRVRPLRLNPHRDMIDDILKAAHDRLRRRRLSAALATARAAPPLAPQRGDVWKSLGCILNALGRSDEADAAYRRAAVLVPEDPDVPHMIAYDKLNEGRSDEALAALRRALVLAPDKTDAHRFYCAAQLYAAGVAPEQRFAAERRRAALTASPASTPQSMPVATAQSAPAATAQSAGRPAAGRKLRIGYVSSDLRSSGKGLQRPHPIAANFEPILRDRDSRAFEAFIYAEIPRPDAVSRKMQSLADGWRSTVGLSDQEVAAMIREDGVDILVFLAGHFDANRLSLASLRPAPVQVSFHDAATSGLDAMDALIADPVLAPRGANRGFAERFCERVIRLPSFYTHLPPDEQPQPGPSPMRRNRYVTFGSLNNPAKLNDATLAFWGTLMAAAPRSRLLLQYQDRYASPSLRKRIADAVQRAGVNPKRLDFVTAALPAGEHLSLYRRIDIGLDPFPFSGSTTSFESLWMGVPVIALPGEFMLSRWTASLLTAVGLEEFIAKTQARAVDIVRRYASDPRRAARLRAGLRDRIRSSAILDGSSRARQIERIFKALWSRRLAGSRPRDS